MYCSGCDQGEPVSSNSPYWWAKTKMHLTTYLIQREPYHLTDGIWLRGIQQGPMSSIQAKLFSIYIDELGNGDINQNHPNVYLNVLKDLGLHVPSITSKEFVQQKSILDISFKKPLLTLTTSLFPNTFQPEILGYTLVSFIFYFNNYFRSTKYVCDSSLPNKSKELVVAIDYQLFFLERGLWTGSFFVSGSIGELFFRERGLWTSSFRMSRIRLSTTALCIYEIVSDQIPVILKH